MKTLGDRMAEQVTWVTYSNEHSWNVDAAKHSGSVFWNPQYPSSPSQTIRLKSLYVVAHAYNAGTWEGQRREGDENFRLLRAN